MSEKSLSGSKGRGITRNVVVVIRIGFLWILTKEWLPTCLGGPLAVTRDSDPKERSGSRGRDPKRQGGYLELGQGFDEVSASNPPTGGGQGRRSHPSKMGGKGKQIRKTQAEPQWIVAQRLLSALTIPGFS